MRLSIGILGCGSIARTHAGVLRGMPEARIAAVCDSDASRAQALAETLPGARWSSDAGEILGASDIDAVYICTRHDSHAPLAVATAEAGKHIYLEKPLALTMEDCDRIGTALRGSSSRLMTGFNHRFHPSVRAAAAHVPEPQLVIAQVCDERWPDDFWANDPAAGGGNVLSQGCHLVDLVCMLHAAPPVRVQAEAGNLRHPGLDIIDTLTATLLFANGGVATLAIADGGTSPLVSKWSLQLMGGSTSAHVHDRFASVTLHRERSTLTQKSDTDISFTDINAHFIRGILRGEPFRTGFAEGRRATAILLRALYAARTGTAQPLDDLPDDTSTRGGQ
ncbi:MAG: Gfo/Idh/MocA family oxidoreductase [Ignavibacteriae bacterium]|nr:Gfo/Idh/MocA family oxidoreductase [Ignavibacteriota bacterium]